MGIQAWANRVNAEANRRREETPLKPVWDDDGHQAPAERVGRSLLRLPGETRAQTAQRQLQNMKNDLWEAVHPDMTALFAADDGASRPGNGPVTNAVGKGLGWIIGAAADVMQAPMRVGTALARGASALVNEALE
jgi:hypothetical protein